MNEYNNDVLPPRRQEEKSTRLGLEDGKWIDIVQEKPGTWYIAAENIIGDFTTELVLWVPRQKPAGLLIEDEKNPDFQFQGVSQKFRWSNVKFDLENRTIEAPSLDDVKEALNHIELGGFNRKDI